MTSQTHHHQHHIKPTNFSDSNGGYFSSPMRVLHFLQINMGSSKGLKTIAVNKENWLALRRLGYASESFNDVITRLVSQAKRED